jgi:bifunctional N-acetylglucosamine-1-phosphate-uridyltransferase/glucosamine-1-phosphate-acetyltransferase GlmU-like protein
MTGPSLVVLAAGRGRRFGGLKQLAAVRADRATVTDVLLQRAAEAGVERAVIVLRSEIEPQVRAHLDAIGWPSIPTGFAVQPQARGTADAVLAARDAVDGPVIVVNADDLYPVSAFRALVDHLRDAPDDEHAAVAFRLDRTLLGTRPESRALLAVGETGLLVGVREGRIEKADGLRFVRGDEAELLRGDELVSMNMWAFRPAVFADILAAVSAHDDAGEIYLPDVVARMIATGATVRVLRSDEPCIGLTYGEDVDALRTALS